jgi:hypothetical protein
MSSITEILGAHVEATKRQWPGGRLRDVGASEIGGCARRTHLVKHEAEHDRGHSDSWGAATRGTVIETHFLYPAFKRHFGANLKFAGPHQQTLKHGYLSATPDGLVINQPRDALAEFGVEDIGPGGCHLIEFKTIDPRATFDRERDGHAYQCQVQLGLVRELTQYKPEVALIVYLDASIWHETRAFPVRFDEKIFGVAMARATKIITACSAFDLPPEGHISGGRECAWCPFKVTCGVRRADVPNTAATPTAEFVAEAAALAREFKILDAAADEAATKARAARKALTDRLRDERVRDIKTDDISISWSSVRGRETVDVKALRAAAAKGGIDINQFVSISERSNRLTIRLKD